MWALKWVSENGGACHCALTECRIKPHFPPFFINIESQNSSTRHYHISISTFSTSFCYFDEYVKASVLSSNFRFGSSLLARWSCHSHVYPIPQQIPSDWTETTAAGAFEHSRELKHMKKVLTWMSLLHFNILISLRHSLEVNMKTRGDGQTALFACQKNDCLIHFDWLFDAAHLQRSWTNHCKHIWTYLHAYLSILTSISSKYQNSSLWEEIFTIHFNHIKVVFVVHLW